jgi:hypothetical protein
VSRVFVINLGFILLSFFGICQSSFAQLNSDNYTEIFKTQRQSQGEMYFLKASEQFKDGNYKSCIDKINEFLFLFPGHYTKLPNR